MADETEPTNVVNMQVQGRLIREAREARERRSAERKYGPLVTKCEVLGPDGVLIKHGPGGIDDMGLG